MDSSAFDIALHTSIDLISVSIKCDCWFNLLETLQKEGFVSTKGFSKNHGYKKLTKLLSEKWGVHIEFLFGAKTFLPDAYLTIHDPSLEFVAWFNSTLDSLGISAKLSEIELTFDFYDGDPSLETFLRKHLFLRYSSQDVFAYASSYYSTNTRKSRKGNIVYSKCVHENHVTRLELKIKREIIKRLDIDTTLQGINDINILDFFYFRDLNLPKLRKRYKRIYRKEKGLSSRKKLEWKELVIDNMMSRITSCPPDEEILKHISERFGYRIETMRFYYLSSLMHHVSILKEIIGSHYSDYLIDFEAFNLWFKSEVDRQGFLKTLEELTTPKLKFFTMQSLGDKDIMMSSIDA